MKVLKQIGGIWIFFLLMSLFFAYSYYPIRPALWSKLLALQIVSMLFSFFMIFKYRKLPLFVPKSRIVLLYSLFIVSLIPSCIFAVNTALAWSEFAKLFSFFIIFLLVYYVDNQYDIKDYFLKGLLVLVFLSMMIGILQLVFMTYGNLPSDWFDFIQKHFGNVPVSSSIHQKTYFLKSIFAHRNMFAQIILLSMPFIGFTTFRKKGFWKYLAYFNIIIMLLFMIFLYVRSIWIIGILSFFIGILLIIFSLGLSIFRTKSSLFSLIVIAMVMSVSIKLIQSNKNIKETFTKQSYFINDSSFGSANERLLLWKASIPMIKDNLLVGVGLNNWGVVIPKYLKNELRDVHTGNYTQFQRPHNDYLQLIAEYGVFAFLLFAFFILWVLILLLKSLFIEKNQEEKLWLISLILFIVIYLGISFFSFPRERIEHQLLLNLVLAFSLSKIQNIKRIEQLQIAKPLLVLLPFTAIWIPLIAHSTLMLQSDINIKKAYIQRAKGNNAQYKYFKKAKQTFYNIDPNGTPIDWYLSYQYSSLGNISMAERSLKSALKAHPYHKHSLNDLGTIVFSTSGSKAAEILYSKALDIAPNFVDANVNIAILKIQATEYDTAWYFLSNCDTSNYHNYYRLAIHEVGLQIGKELYNKIEPSDSLFAFTINRIIQDRNWIWLSHKHAIENNQNLKQQFIDEAVYVLFEEGEINQSEAENIKNKYKK